MPEHFFPYLPGGSLETPEFPVTKTGSEAEHGARAFSQNKEEEGPSGLLSHASGNSDVLPALHCGQGRKRDGANAYPREAGELGTHGRAAERCGTEIISFLGWGCSCCCSCGLGVFTHIK